MKRRRIAIFATVALLALGAAGCSRADATPVAQDLMVHFDSVPNPPVANQDVELRMHVMRGSQEVEGATVTAFVEMKEMDHGENRVTLQDLSGGVYSGHTKLPMGGEWIAHVRVEQNGKTETANVPFQVSE